jgi:RNA polymerase sigma-70 factor (ECF subfamily)
MLGSLDDADEALQDALLNAWRALDSYRGPAPLAHWLYRITTNSSLKVIRAKARRPVPAGEIGYLQPYPDRLLDQLTDDDADPAAVAERRESVTLAFITALQRLPARQRAALILRDVLAWNAAEAAVLLDISVPAVNSAVQRARAALSGTRPAATVAARMRLDDHQRQVLDPFIDAWQRCDIEALATLLREDVVLSMPPELTTIAGRAQVAGFFATVPAGGRLDHPPGHHRRQRPPGAGCLPARQVRALPWVRNHGVHHHPRRHSHDHRLPQPRPVPQIRPAPYLRVTAAKPAVPGPPSDPRRT